MTVNNIGKILVVDDEVELKNILVEALTSQGYEAAGFTSGEEALAALRGEAFDVLLTDLMMPGMDGIALVREALKIDQHLIAIMMTGQGTIQTAVDAMKVGAFDYVLKPFRLRAVMPVLTRAINARRLRLENLQLRETVAIYELCQTIAFTLDPQTIISKLADAALQQTEADEVSILLLTQDGDELYVAAVRGENRQRLLGERVPLEDSISGWVARERAPLILDGEVNDERFRALWPHPEIRSAISVPMQVAGKLIGTININALDRGRPFTLGQLKALTILASTAAAALQSASLYGQVRQAEENYRSIFENAVEGIFQSTPEGRFITVNPAFARILGYDSAQDVLDTITDIDQQVYASAADRVRSNEVSEQDGLIHGFEFEALRKSGDKIWLSVNRRAIRDENGQTLYYEGSVEDITERKRAEAALRESEERYKNLTDTAFDGVVIHRDGKILSVNRAYAEMFGYTVEELIGDDVLKVTPDDQRDFVRAQIAGERGVYEAVGLKKDGTVLVIEVSGQTCAYQGRPARVAAVRDITERKRAEETLQSVARSKAESLALLDTILATAPIGFAFHDRDLLYQRINESLAAINGLSVEEHIGLKLSEVLPEMAPVLEPLLVKVLHTGEPVMDMELGGETRGDPGKLHHWLVSFYPVRLKGGEILGVGVLVSDVTERKRAEEALRESEERYRDLVENAHDIIYSHDLEGNYTSMNKAGETITGYTVEEALKLNMADTVAPEHLPIVLESMRRKLAGEKVTAYEIDIIAKDGHRATLEVNTKYVIQDGQPVAVQGIARDVTERKLLEEQLRQSQKMEAIGQLAGGVAHDFNNLLTAINGYSSLALQRLDESSSIKPYLEEVKKAGDRAANLTRQLLAFGRKQILQPIPLDLNSIVADLNKMLRRLIGEDIDLNAKLASDLKRIQADPGQIEQVLVNLVVNARDAMPQGGSLTIETASVELDREYAKTHAGVQPGNYVMLAVSDTGTGMSEETRRRIFEPFFTTKEKGKGTGLGLSTVYGIVQQSGGSIWVYSELNRGTSFKVYLPQLEAPVTTRERKSSEEAVPRGSETVLLVEDEEVVRGLAAHILEEAGYNVIKARGGDEAIQLCKKQDGRIDLLLTDVVMPEISGKEVAQRITALLPHLKVLFMSGYTDEAIVHHGVLDSSVEFIQKPFTPLGLSKKVREVLDANGSRTGR